MKLPIGAIRKTQNFCVSPAAVLGSTAAPGSIRIHRVNPSAPNWSPLNQATLYYMYYYYYY